MDIDNRANNMALTFCNGMFSGHQEIYQSDLKVFLEKELLAFAAEVRRDALEEAAFLADHIYARRPGGPPAASDQQTGYVMAMREVVFAIRAMIDTPPSDAPDPGVALAKLFADLHLGRHNGWHTIAEQHSLLKPIEYGVWESKPTDLGKAALRLAEGR